MVWRLDRLAPGGLTGVLSGRVGGLTRKSLVVADQLLDESINHPISNIRLLEVDRLVA